MNSPARRVLVTVTGLLFCLAGCTDNQSESPATANAPGLTDTPHNLTSTAPTATASPSSTPVVGLKIADNLPDLFREVIETLDPPPAEREVLERAISTGRIAPADYEAAHQQYVQCMIQEGFHPQFRKSSQGFYVDLPYTAADRDALGTTETTCG